MGGQEGPVLKGEEGQKGWAGSGRGGRGAIPVVRVSLSCAIAVAEVLVGGLVTGSQEDMESTQATHKTAITDTKQQCQQNHTSYTRLSIVVCCGNSKRYSKDEYAGKHADSQVEHAQMRYHDTRSLA